MTIPSIHPYYFSRLKRSFDLTLASLLLVVLSPMLAILAGIIWLTAGRPIFFVQRRLGWHNQVFTLYKFRTMRLGAEKLQAQLAAKNEAPAPMFKLHHDPRFVGVGRWLSNTGLDELPQLINILRGEMSFIGPRPLPVAEAKALFKLHPEWKFRQAVKPGILSEWSLDGHRHRSLAHWRSLDALTVQRGGLGYELTVVITSALAILRWTAKTSLQRVPKVY